MSKLVRLLRRERNSITQSCTEHAALSRVGHIAPRTSLSPLRPGLGRQGGGADGLEPHSRAGQLGLADASTEAAVSHLPGFLARAVTDKG